MAQRPKSRAVGTEKRTPKSRAAADEAVATKRAAAKAPAKKSAKVKPAAAPKAAAKKVAAKKPAAKKAAVTKPAAKAQRSKPAVAGAKSPARSAATSAKPATKATRAKAPTPAKVQAKPAAKTPAKAAKSATGKSNGRKAAASKTPRAKAPQPYLAAELGQPVDHDGEPIGAGSPRAQSDRELQEYALQLWRQMQSGSVTKRYMRSIERAGLTVDDIWVSGVRDTWPTSSTPDEMRRYRQKALFRANLLEAILSETVGDLRRLEGIEPTPAEPTGEPAPEPG